MSSFPLTNSYFSRWVLHHQPVNKSSVDVGPQELSGSIIADKLHYLRGGIAAWLHEVRHAMAKMKGTDQWFQYPSG